MKNKIFDKAFFLGFLVGFLSFVIFNLMTFTLESETRLYHRMNNVGFPFGFYEWGGNPYVERFSQFGLIADGAIILIYSILLGFIFRYLWKLQTAQMK